MIKLIPIVVVSNDSVTNAPGCFYQNKFSGFETDFADSKYNFSSANKFCDISSDSPIIRRTLGHWCEFARHKKNFVVTMFQRSSDWSCLCFRKKFPNQVSDDYTKYEN